MKTTYFKTIGLKISGKIVLLSVLNESDLGMELPNIFEVQCLKLPETIYTGTYPTIKINTETLKDLKTDKKKDDLGIGLKSAQKKNR